MLVRPLAWREPTDHPQDHDDALLVADGIGGRYSIADDEMGGFMVWWAHDCFSWTQYPTIEAAKAAVQEDFERRVRPLLAIQ